MIRGELRSREVFRSPCIPEADRHHQLVFSRCKRNWASGITTSPRSPRVSGLLLVVGPKAAMSDYVPQEWQFALQADTTVTPILGQGDYPPVPDGLKLFHGEDFGMTYQQRHKRSRGARNPS